MSDASWGPTLPTPSVLPEVFMPDYAPGLKVESYRDPEKHEMVVDVSLTVARTVRVSEDTWVRDERPVLNNACEQAVRQMQTEAVTGLGLQHWRTEVEREARDAERKAGRELLRALATAVRNAPTTDRAALIILDELEVIDQ